MRRVRVREGVDGHLTIRQQLAARHMTSAIVSCLQVPIGTYPNCRGTGIIHHLFYVGIFV